MITYVDSVNMNSALNKTSYWLCSCDVTYYVHNVRYLLWMTYCVMLQQ